MIIMISIRKQMRVFRHHQLHIHEIMGTCIDAPMATKIVDVSVK